jgi:chemotaxis protein methyltransferase CheR
MTDAELVSFLQDVLPRMGMRWPGFRKVRGQVRKRLSRRLREIGLEDLDAYRVYLDAHEEEWAVLDPMCRITISRFYRDRAVYDALRDSVLPSLTEAARARGEKAVRCWSAGCASGEEPYSLALCWYLDVAGRAPGLELRVTATDADPQLLERAREGCYPAGALRELPPDWRTGAFAEKDGERWLRARYRTGVEFVEQDIRTAMPPGPFDMVLCRNLVFTYFDEVLQGDLLGRMLARLSPGGTLVLGGHEELPPGSWSLIRPSRALPIFIREPTR